MSESKFDVTVRYDENAGKQSPSFPNGLSCKRCGVPEKIHGENGVDRKHPHAWVAPWSER